MVQTFNIVNGVEELFLSRIVNWHFLNAEKVTTCIFSLVQRIFNRQVELLFFLLANESKVCLALFLARLGLLFWWRGIRFIHKLVGNQLIGHFFGKSTRNRRLTSRFSPGSLFLSKGWFFRGFRLDFLGLLEFR